MSASVQSPNDPAATPAVDPEPRGPADPAGPAVEARDDVDEAVLERLEADLVAVEEALATLDRITAEESSGAAVAQIEAVVSAQRFPLADDVDGTGDAEPTT